MTLFGTLPGGQPVHQIALRSGRLECEILTYGGAIRTLRCPDKNGDMTDVLLGFDTLEDYVAHDAHMGALIGRFANRIGSACFELEGTVYSLAANDGQNHLHGGTDGFDRKVWTVQSVTQNTLVLSYVSPDGEEGYPGTLSVQVTYTLEQDALYIDYRAQSDKTTLCNLTNHVYFNLSGHGSGPVLDQKIKLFARHYTPCGPGSIPTGEIVPVEGTPMDLRTWVTIGEHIDDEFTQLTDAGGYDHNWCLDGESGVLRPAAAAYSAETGIRMEVETTLPGIQFYSGNYLDGSPAGKGNAPYAKHWGFCLETQLFPDAPHHENFRSAALYPGQEFRAATVYRFRCAEII